jgi:putative multiple sugar transport system substrate-binding protein
VRKVFFSVSAGVLALTMAACGSSSKSGSAAGTSSAAAPATSAAAAAATTAAAAAGGNGQTIGIAMPTKTSQRWIADGDNMVKQFTAAGYKTDLQYANNDIQGQVSQIENMITKGDKVLVIAAIDGTALTNTLADAAKAGIKVIAYDRLIRNSPNVDYYATFDNFKVGVLQASYIETALGLKDGKGPFNIELFAGSPDDNNASFFFNGAMSILQPYITSGKLVVKSGQTAFQKVATLRWDGAVAQSRMDNILSRYYTSANVDAVLSPYDGLSRGIIAALQSAGKTNHVVITGQDAEVESVKFIIKGTQTQTVYKDTRLLAKQTVLMTTAMLKGTTVPVNDTKQYNNGIKVVPTFLLQPVSVDKSNYEQVLVGGGYYKDSDLK